MTASYRTAQDRKVMDSVGERGTKQHGAEEGWTGQLIKARQDSAGQFRTTGQDR
jgi:hypothetical protein